MSTFIQVHTLTSLPPSCVNRDDQGRPKSAIFGGVTRLRISSQSQKRAWRTNASTVTLLGPLGSRTQRVGEQVYAALISDGVDEKKAVEVSREVAAVFGKPQKNGLLNEQLAFVDPVEMASAVDAARLIVTGEKVALDDIVRKQVSVADIALFGRMFADNPDRSLEAAASVAHAITTHKAAVEDDYYVACDDLKTAETDAGAGFIGEAGFGAGVFYGYANINVDQLLSNLNGDEAAARRAVEALITGAATVQPAAKRSTFAHGSRASYAAVEVGEYAPRSLVSAFETPVDRVLREGEGLTEASVRVLRDMRSRFASAYGEQTEIVELNVPEGSGSLEALVAHGRSVFGDNVVQLQAAE
jgi:CRISPR system Cascade subunit CasC